MAHERGAFRSAMGTFMVGFGLGSGSGCSAAGMMESVEGVSCMMGSVRLAESGLVVGGLVVGGCDCGTKVFFCL